jgi:hypothetical protein
LKDLEISKYKRFFSLERPCLDEGESLKRCLCIGYSTIETKEVERIGYNGFLFPHEYSGEGRGA